jgi:hypothetical protein
VKSVTLAFIVLVGVSLFCGTSPAVAHSAGMMLIGKDMADPNHGNLKIEYEFDRHVAATYYYGVATLFETMDLGFNAAEDDPPHIYEVDLGTDVNVEVVYLSPNVQLELNSTLITAPGTYTLGTHTSPSSGLHNHPYFRLTAPTDTSFDEGVVVFRVVQGTNGPGYGPSPMYVVRVTNGFLTVGPDYGTGPAIDQPSLKCQKAIGLVGQKYVGKLYGELRKCFDKIANWKARAKAGHPSAPAAQAAAEKACADASGTGPNEKTLLGKLATLEAKAVSDALMKCGQPGNTTPDGRTIPTTASNDYTAREFRTHLGMMRCQAEESLGAAYFGILEDLDMFTARPSQGGHPLPHYFPCLKAKGEAH